VEKIQTQRAFNVGLHLMTWHLKNPNAMGAVAFEVLGLLSGHAGIEQRMLLKTSLPTILWMNSQRSSCQS